MARSARLGKALPATLATLAVALSPLQASADPVLGPLETVSVAVDSQNQAGWWTPIDEFDGAVYMAYNYDYLPDEGRHEVKVVRRDAPNDFTIDCLRETAGEPCTTFVDDRGHNQPSIAVDGDGYIHVFTAMHNNTWRYYRSAEPGDPTTMVNRSAELPNQNLLFTYPSLDRAPDGDVWMIIRSRTPGMNQAGGQLYHWHADTGQWTWTSFAFESGMFVYPDDVQVTPDGNVHIAFEWAHTPSGVRHESSYLQYRPAMQTFHNIGGTQVSQPVTRSTPGLIYQPLLAGETYGGSAGLQNAKMAMYEQDGSWLPAMGYRYRMHGSDHFQIRYAYHDSGTWHREVRYNSDTHPAIGITHNGTTVRIYYAKANPDRAQVAESTAGGPWNHSEIGAGNPIQRLAVTMRADGTDLAYLVAPFAISNRRGHLYFRALERSLPSVGLPTTGFEDRGGSGWTTHAEESDFLAELADESPRVEFEQVGESVQGRPIHLIKVGHPTPPDDAQIATGKSVLVIGAQHGNEPSGQEAALQLARDMAFSEDQEIVDQLSDTTVLFIPTANPDGLVANTRANANGVNINRDHLRFATPEGQAVAAVSRNLWPDIVADLHERPGGTQPDMEMVWSLNLNVDAALRWFGQGTVEDNVFPSLNARGFTTGELGRPGTTAYDERIARNAVGLRHSIGMVTETPWNGQPLRRVATQKATVDEILALQRTFPEIVAALTEDAADRRAADGAAGALFYFGGPEDPVADPAGCGYLINIAQAAFVERPLTLFGVETEQVSANGVFVTMAQPMMTVVPLLLDQRAPNNVVAGRSLTDCSDPGSETPPPDPPAQSPPAQYSTDFSADTAGLPPNAWTPEWRASHWLVRDNPRRLEHSVVGESGRRALTWGDVGDDGMVTGDVEILGLFRAPAAGDTIFQMGVHISGAAGSENAYYVDARMPGVSVDPNHIRINRYADGAATFLAASALPFTLEQGSWYRVVLRRDGESLRAKIWPNGTDEPGWQVTVSADSQHNSGRVGVSHFTPGIVNDWAFIGVGTGGDSPPRAP